MAQLFGQVVAEAERQRQRCREAAHRRMWKKVKHGGMGGGGEA
jgi:hypothetical protein